MVDKHEEITLPIVLSCNYQSDITYPGQKQFDCGNPVIDKFVRASLKKIQNNRANLISAYKFAFQER